MTHNTMAMQIERMTLEAEHVQDPSVAPVDHRPAAQNPPVWRGLPVQMQLPPHTGPVKVNSASCPFNRVLCKDDPQKDVSGLISVKTPVPSAVASRQ